MQTVQTEYFFFLILVFAFTFDSHFLGSKSQVSVLLCVRVFVIYETGPKQASLVCVDSIDEFVIDFVRETPFQVLNMYSKAISTTGGPDVVCDLHT